MEILEQIHDLFANTKNFAPKVINEIDRLTDDILDKLYNPTIRDVKGIDKKGLVVGQVQSGKQLITQG